MKKFSLLTLIIVLNVAGIIAQTSKIQFIHNSPDTSLSEVDIYSDGILVVNNLSFKSGTSFIEVTFSGSNAEIMVTDSNSSSVVYIQKQQELIDDERYYLVLDGIFDTDAYEGIEEIALYSYEGARVEATYPSSEVSDLDILTHHGALGFSHELDAQGTQLLAFPLEFGEALLFGDFSDSLEENNYSIWASDSQIGVDIADFNGIGGNQLSQFGYFTSLDLGVSGFPDYADQAIIMLLTGFQNPEDFDNGEPFEAYLLGPEGGDFQPLLSAEQLVVPAFALYPNPVNDVFNLESQIPFSAYTIYDLRGAILKQDSFLERATLSLKIDELNTGVYFIKVKFQKNNASVTKRIIKK